jgi:RNA polymerase sigma-70 factor (ECF subfamily)
MTPPPWIPGNCSCPSTDWGIVRAAARPTDTTGKTALTNLCLRYWYPIYAFIRRDAFRRGKPEARAQELTQDFIAHILANRFLADANPEKGSFRAYLLTACRNFLISQYRKPDVLNGPVVSLDAFDPPAPETSEFDCDWAVAVLTNALDVVRRRYADRGKAELFDRLRAYLPLHDGELPGPQGEAAENGDQSVEAFRKALHDLRRVVAEQVRHEMAQTLSDPAAVEEEIRDLLANVRRLPTAARNAHPAPEARR